MRVKADAHTDFPPLISPCLGLLVSSMAHHEEQPCSGRYVGFTLPSGERPSGLVAYSHIHTSSISQHVLQQRRSKSCQEGQLATGGLHPFTVLVTPSQRGSCMSLSHHHLGAGPPPNDLTLLAPFPRTVSLIMGAFQP